MTAAAGPSADVAIAVSVVATLVVVGLLGALRSCLSAARRLRAAADTLEADVREVLRSVDGTLAHASAELERVDDLIGSAEQLTEVVGVASRVAYTSLASPLIKVLAFSRGTSRASQKFRGRERALRAKGR